MPALVIATYNIHRCVGSDGCRSPERIARVIRELRPDVVALQEVDSEVGSELGDQAAFLAARTGMEAFVGPTLRGVDTYYGNAVLSRLPVRSIREIDLSEALREPRNAMDLQLGWGSRRIRLVATHLGLRMGERRRQVHRLLGNLESNDDDLLVLLGDFNLWLWFGSAIGRLEARFGSPPAPRSFPARRPVFALDRVWVEPRTLLVGVRAHDSPLARLASDHLPVYAQILANEPALRPA